MMKKKIISMVLVLTMATGLMTGCGSKGTEKTEQKDADTSADTSADTTENITVTMASNPFVGLAPFYVAMDKGFFKDCGLDFSMVDFDDSSASCSALLAGKVDLAYTTLDAAIIAESQYDEDMLDVTAIVDESAGADGILVKNDINSIAVSVWFEWQPTESGHGFWQHLSCLLHQSSGRCRSCQYDIFGCRSIFYQR